MLSPTQQWAHVKVLWDFHTFKCSHLDQSLSARTESSSPLNMQFGVNVNNTKESYKLL